MVSKYDNSQNLQMIACGYGVHSNLFDFLKPIEILKLKESLCGESEIESLCDESETESLCDESETFTHEMSPIREARRSYIKRYIDEAFRFKLLNFLNITDKKTFNELFDNGIMFDNDSFSLYCSTV